MPADLKRLHKYMLEVEHIGIISDELREVIEELWPELAHELPPKRPLADPDVQISRFRFFMGEPRSRWCR